MDNIVGAEYHLENLAQGTDFSMVIIFDEDITNWAFDAHIVARAKVRTVKTSFTIDIDTETKTVTLSLTRQQISALPPGILGWEFIVTDATGLRQRWLYGDAEIVYREDH